MIPRLVAALALAALALLSGCAAFQPLGGDTGCRAAAGCLALERGDGGSPIIRAELNGSGPYFFVLDTGSSGTTVDEQTAAKLGLARDAATEQGQGWGGGMEVHAYRILKFQAGPLSQTDFIAPGLPAPDFASHRLTGLAGVDLFGSRLITWDVPHGRLLTAASGAKPGPGDWRPLASNWIRPWKVMAPVSIAGIDGWGLLDTGAQNSTLNPAFADALGLTEASGRLQDGGEVSGIDGQPLRVRRANLAAVRIGQWRWSAAAANVAALPFFDRLGKPDERLMIIGIDWLKDHAFAMDYGRQVVWQKAD